VDIYFRIKKGVPLFHELFSCQHCQLIDESIIQFLFVFVSGDFVKKKKNSNSFPYLAYILKKHFDTYTNMLQKNCDQFNYHVYNLHINRK
jgi:hypothetical protein